METPRWHQTRSRALLIVATLACAAVLVLALVTWERTATASPQLRVLLLIVIPGGGLLSALAAWRLDDRGRTVIIRAAVAGATALVLTELLLTLLWFGRSLDHLPFDGRDKERVVLDLRAEGIDAMPSIEPKTLLIPDADGSLRARTEVGGEELQVLSGVAHRHTVVCNETGTWVFYTSDRYGMPNPDRVWDEPVSVAALGDAFANGWCAGSDVHFMGLLRRDQPAMVNLGQSGNGPLLTLASMVEYLPQVRPRIVYWFYYELNDLDDLTTELLSPLLRRYQTAGFRQMLTERQDAVDQAVGGVIRKHPALWRHGNLQVGNMSLAAAPAFVRGLVTLPRTRQLLDLTYGNTPVAHDYPALTRIFRRAVEETSRWNSDLRLVYLPAAPRYRALWRSRDEYEVERLRVREIAEGLGIEVVDLHEVFSASGTPLALFNPIAGGGYGHYTAEGHRLVADALLANLAR